MAPSLPQATSSPVRSVFRDLEAYAEALAAQTQQPKVEVRKLIVPIVVNYLASDLGLSQTRKRTLTSLKKQALAFIHI